MIVGSFYRFREIEFRQRQLLALGAEFGFVASQQDSTAHVLFEDEQRGQEDEHHNNTHAPSQQFLQALGFHGGLVTLRNVNAPADYQQSSPTPRRLLAWALALSVATFSVYAQTWKFQMLYWDDDVNVLENPLVHQPNLAGLKQIFTKPFSTDYYPLTYISLALDQFIWGRFAGYHVTQALLHSLNGFLVVLLGYRLTQSAPAALLAGAWFAWHPVQVESVAWIAERKNVLGMCLFLLAWLAYLKARTPREGRRPTTAGGWRLASVGLFTLAVLSHALVIGMRAL